MLTSAAASLARMQCRINSATVVESSLKMKSSPKFARAAKGNAIAYCLIRLVLERQRSFSLQMVCVMVPIGQKAHQLRGFQSTMAIRPSSREVSIRL